MNNLFIGKNIIIFGATGSWGHELTKQLLEFNPKEIIIFSRGELAQVNMQRKFRNNKLKFIIGDVRDYGAVDNATRSVDYVFLLAALKHVPVCENQPQEAIKTNIGGTINVINSSIKHKVKKVIDVSTDKACLDYFQTVELMDGKKRNIRDIVKNKETLKVKSWDGKKFVSKKVIGWFKNKLAGRTMYRIRYINSPIFGKNKSSVTVTEDHLLLTKNGWLPAMELNSGDEVYTSDVIFNNKQRAFILGTVLGDAHIYKRNKFINRANLKISQCKKQEAWVELKYKCVEEVANEIHEYENKRRQNSQNMVFFVTRSNLYLSELHENCYKEGKKIIPRELVKNYLQNPETIGIFLSALFMDDGCVSNNLFRIATHGFTKEDVDWLAGELTSLGYMSYTYGCTVGHRTYPELRFTKKGSNRLASLISPYILPSMRYKLQSDRNNEEYDESIWDMGITEYLTAKISINKHEYITSRDVYCVDVEDTHNFVSGGVVVHNCSPTNLYGFTKAVGEKLIIQANMLSKDTEFVCVRGGNVLGSNGSVVPLFINQIKQFNEITVTDELMTRFFLTLPEAISLLFQATERSIGGETFVMNMPAFFIGDLAKVLIKHYGNKNTSINIIGLLPGEKKHELLISEHEAHRSFIFDEDYYVILPELKINRDYTHINLTSRVKFDSFSSSDNVKDVNYLTVMLDRGGFLI